MKRHVLAEIDEEGLLGECVDSTRHSLREYVKSSKQEEEDKNEFLKELDESASVYATHSENDKSIVRAHGVRMITAENKPHACANLPHNDDDDGEAADVPELEDCSTSSEEEEVCKSVLETSTHASDTLDEIVLGDTMLQPTANGIKVSCAEDDENSIDKHQILPLEACKQCKTVNSEGFHAFDSSSKCVCDTNRGLHKLEVTDAELQDAASEFYTLEGDVLWSESDLKKKPDCRRLDKVQTSCELCKHGMFPVSSESFSIFPSRACTGAKTFAHKPVSSKVVYYVDAMRAQEESGSEGSVRVSAEDMNEDVIIDQELRAIASRSGNRGEESNYMSTAGSFRDFMGSFREFDGCWSEYSMMGRREDDFVTGCCDDHARPCISHSRSRSKVLQSDPLLSKASLIREQEIMDVLWQEYNEDRRQRYNNVGKLQKDNAHKQRFKAGADSSSSIHEVLDEGNPAESISVQANEYVMKLNNGPEYGNYDRNNADHCRLGCDKPCWHMAKARSYHRRRHFVGFCRLFRELGLKQCMQSSKVDN